MVLCMKFVKHDQTKGKYRNYSRKRKRNFKFGLWYVLFVFVRYCWCICLRPRFGFDLSIPTFVYKRKSLGRWWWRLVKENHKKKPVKGRNVKNFRGRRASERKYSVVNMTTIIYQQINENEKIFCSTFLTHFTVSLCLSVNIPTPTFSSD